jgi:hypothetical protein
MKGLAAIADANSSGVRTITGMAKPNSRASVASIPAASTSTANKTTFPLWM